MESDFDDWAEQQLQRCPGMNAALLRSAACQLWKSHSVDVAAIGIEAWSVARINDLDIPARRDSILSRKDGWAYYPCILICGILRGDAKGTWLSDSRGLRVPVALSHGVQGELCPLNPCTMDAPVILWEWAIVDEGGKDFRRCNQTGATGAPSKDRLGIYFEINVDAVVPMRGLNHPTRSVDTGYLSVAVTVLSQSPIVYRPQSNDVYFILEVAVHDSKLPHGMSRNDAQSACVVVCGMRNAMWHPCCLPSARILILCGLKWKRVSTRWTSHKSKGQLALVSGSNFSVHVAPNSHGYKSIAARSFVGEATYEGVVSVKNPAAFSRGLWIELDNDEHCRIYLGGSVLPFPSLGRGIRPGARIRAVNAVPRFSACGSCVGFEISFALRSLLSIFHREKISASRVS